MNKFLVSEEAYKEFKAFLDETFGQDVMKECKEFLDRLKKQM